MLMSLVCTSIDWRSVCGAGHGMQDPYLQLGDYQLGISCGGRKCNPSAGSLTNKYLYKGMYSSLDLE